MKGKFIIIDGLDGSGKGVAVSAIKKWAASKGKKVLDLRDYWKTNQDFPNIDSYEIIISLEPTYINHGKHIRDELIKEGTSHSAEEIAEAFSKDREELYRKIIIPALEKGKHVFQERGITSSLVYQPLQGYPIEKVIGLEGNKFCIKTPPDMIIITTVEPEVVIERLKIRKKQDQAIYEKLDFQKKLATTFKSEIIRSIFPDSKMIYMDTNPPKTVEDTKKESVKIIEEFYQNIQF